MKGFSIPPNRGWCEGRFEGSLRDGGRGILVFSTTKGFNERGPVNWKLCSHYSPDDSSKLSMTRHVVKLTSPREVLVKDGPQQLYCLCFRKEPL